MAKQVKLFPSERFDRDYANLSADDQIRTKKALDLFLQNPHHPSLRIKKMKGLQGVWEGRISHSLRFTFKIRDNACYLRRVGPHEIEQNP